jgi:protein O-mannosyl-transferase
MRPALDRGGTHHLPGSGRASAVSMLAVALLTLLAYWPVQRNGFVLFDDGEYLTRNTIVKQGLTARGLRLALTSSYTANWHPLTWVSHMIDVELFGLAPRGHHLVGLALHLATAVLLLLTLRAMTGRAGPSFLVAALFAVHPLHVESVAWAAERKDVLSAFFWVLTLALYLRHARRPCAGRYLPVLLCFALGLMAKQMLVTLPLVLLLLDWWPLGRSRNHAAAGSPGTRPFSRALLLEKVPLLALATLAGLITVKAQSASGALHSLELFPPAARAANAVLSAVRYLGKTFWPVDLAVFYPFAIRTPADPPIVAAAVLLSVATAAALLLRRRHPWLLTGWLWYLVSLTPVIGLLQVGEQAMADRYTYLPLIGIFIAVAWALPGLVHPRGTARSALAIGSVVVLLLAGLTRRQVAIWRDDETLFSHAIRATGENWKASYSLGLALDAAGDRAGAMQRFREAIRLRPDFPRARFSYALTLDEDGRPAEALEELRRAVRARPEDPVYRITLASLLAREGQEEEAIAQLRELIRLRPEVPEGYNNLAAILARRGRVDEAAALLRRALEIDPSYADARANLEALTGDRPGGEGSQGHLPGVPTTHRGLFGGSGDR